MIITPKELHDRIDEFTVVDVRPETQRNEFPMDGLETIISKDGSTPNIEGKKVLVCQFGIVTEGMIIENDLDNTFSLLGGAQSWIEFQSENEDLSRWSRQNNSTRNRNGRPEKTYECNGSRRWFGWIGLSRFTITGDCRNRKTGLDRWGYCGIVQSSSPAPTWS